MNNGFGSLLKQYRGQSGDPVRDKSLTQERLAELLEEMANLPGFSHATISHWESGRHPIKSTDRHILLGLIYVLSKCGGINSLTEAQKLLFVGNYRALIDKEIKQIKPEWLNDRDNRTSADAQTNTEHDTKSSSHLENSMVKIEGGFVAGDKHEAYQGPVVQSNRGNITIINTSSFGIIREWFSNYFRWDEANDHARSSWAGMVIWSLSIFTDRFSKNVLFYCVGILIWLIAMWLIIPILQWPLDDQESRWTACIKLAAGLVLLPIIIALLTTPDNNELFEVVTWQQKSTLLFLKLTGALVSYFVFSILLLFGAIVWYYMILSQMNVWIWRVLIIVPLFMSHVTARRIPADRYKMFDGVLKPHSADGLFLSVFFFASLLTPAFIYYWYPLLVERIIGLCILLVITSIAFWQHGKSIQNANKTMHSN